MNTITIDSNPIIADDTIFPEQYYDLISRATGLSPELRLMLAILDDALRCWIGKTGIAQNREKRQAEAERWIFGDYETTLSFPFVCQSLDINPDYFRERLLSDKVVAGDLTRWRICGERTEMKPRKPR